MFWKCRMDVGGFAVTFLDTAGLRDTFEEVEAIGIAPFGKARAEKADLRIILHPADQPAMKIETTESRHSRPQ